MNCAQSVYAQQSCGPNKGVCIHIDNNGQPSDDDTFRACPLGRNFFTFSQGMLRNLLLPSLLLTFMISDHCPSGTWMPWCCDSDVDTSGCAWQGPPYPEVGDCGKSDQCPPNYVNLGVSENGGGFDCAHEGSFGYNNWNEVQYSRRALCCPGWNLGGVSESSTSRKDDEHYTNKWHPTTQYHDMSPVPYESAALQQLHRFVTRGLTYR